MSDKRMENMRLLSGLLNAEAKGDQLAKEQIDQMISSVIAKIDAVGNDGGLLADACAKHGVPLCLFMHPNHLPISTTPVDRRLLNECANAASPLTGNDAKDGYEYS